MWLIFEPIKALEIKTSILFNLNLAENIILSRFFLFFWIIDQYFLIPAAIARVFSPIAELVVLIVMPIKEAKAKLEIYPVIVEAKIRKCLTWLDLYKPFFAFYSWIHLALFLQRNNSLFHLYFLNLNSWLIFSSTIYYYNTTQNF